MLARLRLFQIAAVMITLTFMSVMVVVGIIAYTKPSGSTRQDMAKAQLLRKEASLKKSSQSSLISENLP